MQSHHSLRQILIITCLCWLLLLAASCSPAATTAAIPSPTPTAEATTPAAVLTARDAALAFLRTSANECVPRAGVRWRAAPGGAETPVGFGVYRFTAEDCTITVSYTLDTNAGTLYHVALGDSVTGFCWQAVVDANGRVLRTGVAAANEPGEGNPAALYCTQQGYQYEVRAQQDGRLCGICVFPDGNACNSWAFFNGECGPTTPTENK